MVPELVVDPADLLVVVEDAAVGEQEVRVLLLVLAGQDLLVQE